MSGTGWNSSVGRALQDVYKRQVLDCWIDQDLSVFPMVPAGASIDDVFDEEDMKK